MSFLETLTRQTVQLMPQTQAWAQGYRALQDVCKADEQAGRTVQHPTHVLDGKTIYRPLTVEENMLVRIGNWDLGVQWNDSCSAITYGPNGLFKISLVSDDLLRLPRDFNQRTIYVDYDSLEVDGDNVKEFTRADMVSGHFLTDSQVKADPVWQFVAGNALDQYVNRQWQGKKQDHTAMGTYLPYNPRVGETRALFVINHYYSFLHGNYDLFSSDCGSFARVVSIRAE